MPSELKLLLLLREEGDLLRLEGDSRRLKGDDLRGDNESSCRLLELL